MIRKILAVATGFVVWSALWLAANAVLGAAGMLPPSGAAVNELGVLLILLAASVLE